MLPTRDNTLRVVEENVDGCGSDAVEYVMFSKPVCVNVEEEFQRILRDVKTRPESEDYDTEDMILTAIEDFNASVFAQRDNITAEIIDAPYYGVVTF